MDIREDITLAMSSVLSDDQMKRLRNVLDMVLYNYDIQPKTDDDPALFVGKRGRITKDGIEYIIKKLGDSVGVEAHPHKFRRTISTDLLNKGMPVQEVQKMLGHESLDTTMIYCTVNSDSVRNSHQKLA